MKVLVTGTAGFIGFHLVDKLIERGDEVTGLDSLNDYYDISLKYSRLKEHGINKDEVSYNLLVKSTTHANYNFIDAMLF